MIPTLSDVGTAIYGSSWQTELSRALGVSDRTVRRWIADPDGIPPGVWRDLRQLCLGRAAELRRVAETLGE